MQELKSVAWWARRKLSGKHRMPKIRSIYLPGKSLKVNRRRSIGSMVSIFPHPGHIISCTYERLLKKFSGLIGKINVIPMLLLSKKIKSLKGKS